MVLIGSYIEVLNGSRRFLVVTINVSEKKTLKIFSTLLLWEM